MGVFSKVWAWLGLESEEVVRKICIIPGNIERSKNDI